MSGSFTQCEDCANYIYDEEFDEYCCNAYVDEDDVARFMSFDGYSCPYYDPFDDEYKIVRKQN